MATVAPNPMAQKRAARKIEEQAAEAVRRALPEEFVREIEGDPEARKRRKIEEGFGLKGYEAPDEIWYAKSRTVTGGNEMAQVEGGEGQYLIHDAPPEEKENGKGGGGILSSSTLAALKDYSAKSNGKPMVSRGPVAPSAGPLVSYGSEDDSE